MPGLLELGNALSGTLPMVQLHINKRFIKCVSWNTRLQDAGGRSHIPYPIPGQEAVKGPEASWSKTLHLAQTLTYLTVTPF